MKKLFLSLIALGLTACGVNPFQGAETIQQKGYASYGTFVILEEQAAAVAQDPAVPENVKQALRDADKEAKPVADDLHDVLLADSSPVQVDLLIKKLAPLLIKLAVKK